MASVIHLLIGVQTAYRREDGSTIRIRVGSPTRLIIAKGNILEGITARD